MTRNPTDRGRTKVPTLYRTDPSGHHITIQSNQQKGRVLQDYFCPSSESTEPTTFQCAYPKSAIEFTPISNEQIDSAVATLGPMKAPGLNGIGNVIFKQCQTHLGPIFWVMFSTQHYPHSWKESKTVILWKLKKPNYTTPKVYRPITLLDTMSKILSLLGISK